MTKVFDPLGHDTTEASVRTEKFLRAFLFDKTCTDEDWSSAMDALLLLFGRQLLKSDDPAKSIDNAIRMLRFMCAESRKS
jgi:hypothetical protein